MNLVTSQETAVHLKTKMAVIKRRARSQRSHEKIGDCEQSKKFENLSFSEIVEIQSGLRAQQKGDKI